MITVSFTKNINEIIEIWDDLWKHNSCLSYYQSKAYVCELWKNIFPYKIILRMNPGLFIFKENNRIILILPLFKSWFKKHYILMGYKAGMGYLDAIYSDELSIETMSKCMTLLCEQYDIQNIEFKYVKSETTLGKWLTYNSAKYCELECTEIILPDNYDEYYALLSKNARQNIRTAYNRMSKDGAVYNIEAIVYDQMDKSKRSQLQRLYVNRQISRYERGGFLYRMFVKYIDLGTKIQKSSQIYEKAYVLSINGEVAAFFDAIYDSKNVIVPRLAIDEKYSKYSPGIILINEGMKFFIGEGIKKVDLTHGTEKYKLSMGGTIKKCIEGTVCL